MNPTNPRNQMTLSVIVTTKNEERNIASCLDSIKNSIHSMGLTNRDVEVIVVDNNSTDNTVEIAKRFTGKVYNKGPERSAQRNYGVKKAKGKYILYVDADMILSENVIGECVDKCEKGDYIALCIPEKIVGKGFWIKVRDFERSFYDATVIDCVRFIKKDPFEELGGFDESLTGPEDWDFDRRIREVGRVDMMKSPLYHNEGDLDLRHYLRKKSYYARTLGNYIRKWGKDDPIIKKQLGVGYRLFGVFIENGKWKKLLRHPLLAFAMFLLRFMVGIGCLNSGS